MGRSEAPQKNKHTQIQKLHNWKGAESMQGLNEL